MIKKFIKSALFMASMLAVGTLKAAVGFGPGGLFINNQNTLQPNATFYVSSGTVSNLNTNTLKFADGTTMVTAAVSGGGSSSLQVMVNGVEISTPTSSLRFDNNFIGSSPSVGISSITLSPNSTFYIQNNASPQADSKFNVSSGSVNGQFLVNTSRYSLYFAPSSTQAFQIINKSSEAAYIVFYGTNTERWRFGADPRVLQSRDFGIYNSLTNVYTVSVSSSDVITLTGSVVIPGLTASMPVKTNSSKQLVSGLIDVTSDITGTVPSGNLPANVSYNNVQQTVSVNKIYSSSQTFNSDVVITPLTSKNCLGTDSVGKVIEGTCTGGGGGGGSALEVFSNFDSVRSTPTASLATSDALKLTVSGSTAIINVDFSSITAKGNTFNTGSGLVELSGGLIPNSLVDGSSITKQGLLVAGSNVTLTPGAGTLTIAATSGSGDIESVTAGPGLSGGGTSGAVTLSLDPNATHYIHNQNTLQSGATFYVSSGTVNGPLSVGVLTSTQSRIAGRFGDIINASNELEIKMGGGSVSVIKTAPSGVSFWGDSAGFSHTTGDSLLYVGNSAGYYADNVYYNTFIGNNSGINASLGADENTFVGFNSGFSNTSGSHNVFLGSKSGYKSSGNGNTIGSFNTYIGVNAVGKINATGATLIGANATSDCDECIVLGVSDVYDYNVGIGTNSPSYKLHVRGSSRFETGLNSSTITISGLTSQPCIGTDSNGDIVPGTCGGGGGTTIWGQDDEAVVSNAVSTITVNGVLKSTVTATNKMAVFLNYDTNQFSNQASTFTANSSSFTMYGPNIPASAISAGSLGASVLASSIAASGVSSGYFPNANVTVNPQGQITTISTGTFPTSVGVRFYNGGSALSAGATAYVQVPTTFTVTSWSIYSQNSCSASVVVLNDTEANFPPTLSDAISGTEKPSLSAQTLNTDTNLTTWTTTEILKKSFLAFYLESVSTCTDFSAQLFGTGR